MFEEERKFESTCVLALLKLYSVVLSNLEFCLSLNSKKMTRVNNHQFNIYNCMLSIEIENLSKKNFLTEQEIIFQNVNTQVANHLLFGEIQV